MKNKRMTCFKSFSLLFAISIFILMTGCNGTLPAVPIINSFTAIPSSIISGDSSNLSWSITDATSVTIDQGIGSVAADIGTISVHPTETTVYTLTATNAAGSVNATMTILVKEIL